MSDQKEHGSHLVKCAEPECQTWFTVTRENAFQRYCTAHAPQQRPARSASKRTIRKLSAEP